MSRKVLTPKFRVSFPEVFEAKAFDENSKPKYSVTMLFEEGADLSEIEAIIEEAIVEKFGKNVPKNLIRPIMDQGEKEYDGYEAGSMFARASSNSRPGVVDGAKVRITDPEQLYAGCYARATVTAYAYGGAGSKFKPGVALGLGNVQKLAEGEPLGGRTSPEEDFDAVEGAATIEDNMFD